MICPVLKKEDKMEIIYNKPMIANFNEETEEIKIETNEEILEKVANKLIS